MTSASAATLDVLDTVDFAEIAAGFADLSYLQTSAYAEIAAQKIGGRAEFVALRQGGDILSLASVRVRKLPLLGGGIAYIHGGPLIARAGTIPEEETTILTQMLCALDRSYVRERGMVIRIVPSMLSVAHGGRERAVLIASGFAARPAKSAGETFLIDLSDGSAAVRRGFDPKWRSDLTKAEKSGLTVTRSTDIADLRIFSPMLASLEETKGFQTENDADFYMRVQESAIERERVTIHIAWLDGEPVAGHVGDFTGACATYLLGASTVRGNAARASYLLQWKAIEHAIARSALFYDLGGVDQIENPGVFRFKKRMGGKPASRGKMYVRAPNALVDCLVGAAERAVVVLRARGMRR